MTRLSSRALILLSLAGCLVPLAAAQDDGKKVPIRPPLPGMFPGSTELTPEQEMAQLFQKVESRMRSMGSLLLDASAGDTSKLKDAEESGIEELIRDARPRAGASGGVADLLSVSKLQGDRVLNDIDRILEIAAQNGGT